MAVELHPFQRSFRVLTKIEQKRWTALERFLSIFATVQREEALTAFLLMSDIFILLTAYYIIKPVREALILGGPGAEVRSYAGAGQAVLFWLILPFYSTFAARVNRLRLI